MVSYRNADGLDRNRELEPCKHTGERADESTAGRFIAEKLNFAISCCEKPAG